MEKTREKKQISLKTVLVITDILIIFVILAFTVTVMLNVGQKYLKNINDEKNETHLSWLTENAGRNFSVMENVAFSVALDERIRSIVSRNAYNYDYGGGFEEKSDDLSYLKRKFANVVETFSLRLDSVSLFLAETDNKIVDESIPALIYDDELRKDRKYVEFLNSDEIMLYSPVSYSNDGNRFIEHEVGGTLRGDPSYPVISVMCKIQDYAATEFYGVVRVCVKTEDFFAETNSVYGKDSDFSFCYLSGEKIVYGGQLSAKNVLKRDIPKYGLTVAYSGDIDKKGLFFSQIFTPVLPILAAGIALAVASIILFNYFYNKIIVEIRDFGKTDERKKSRFKEVNEYGEKLSGLANKISELEKRSYYLEKKQQQAKLLSLQYQINPHFLFNSLELFRCRADVSGDEAAAEAISDFADIMRYNISDATATSTLYEEIQILEKFVGLFKFKYKDTLKIAFSFGNVPPSTPIMKFLLQPIVENAIKYGKKGKTPMTISVKFLQTADKIFIKIENDGEPIEKNRVDEIRAVLYANGSFDGDKSAKNLKNDGSDYGTGVYKSAAAGGGLGVGLKNVYDRIKLYYGDDGGLEIYSDTEKRLTSITVVIPGGVDF